MTLNIYDLSHEQRQLIFALFDKAHERFPEISTTFDISLNPDNKEHILVDVFVPFFDNERELAFSSYTATIESDSYFETGHLISMMPHYVPEMRAAGLHETDLQEVA
ncbi:MAG: hypothetical protein ACOVSW_10290 [Candidatus Kapaibacteriota bacterium]